MHATGEFGSGWSIADACWREPSGGEARLTGVEAGPLELKPGGSPITEYMKMFQRLSLPRILVVAFAVIALIAVACSDSDEPSDDGSAELPPAAGACLEGADDCQDNPGLGGEQPILDGEPTGGPTGGPVVGGVGAPMLADGGLSVSEALTTDAEGPLAVVAFYYSNSEGTWLCELLAESFPPQCGGERVAFDGDSVIDRDDLDETQGVTWSPQPVTVIGSIVDGAFVATPFAQ